MQKPILTVLLLIVGLFGITKFQDFIKNNTPETNTGSSVIVEPIVENSSTTSAIIESQVEDHLDIHDSTTTDSLASSTMKMN